MEEIINILKAAVESLNERKPFVVGDIRLEFDEQNILNIIGWSQYSNFTNLTKRQSLRELDEIKSLFANMVNASTELKNFIKGESIQYNLYFDDYSKASIRICFEKNKMITWEANIKD